MEVCSFICAICVAWTLYLQALDVFPELVQVRLGPARLVLELLVVCPVLIHLLDAVLGLLLGQRIPIGESQGKSAVVELGVLLVREEKLLWGDSGDAFPLCLGLLVVQDHRSRNVF